MLVAPEQPEPPHRGTDSTRIWLRRLLVLLTILSSIALTLVIFWGASHITTSLLIVIVAALIAYAIVPVVEFFHRIMPRPLAILLAYLLVVIVLGGVIYFVVTTAVFQITLIVHSITHWLTPDRSGKSPLLQLLLNTGLTQGQIDSFQQQLVGSLSNVAGSLASGLVPMLGGVAGSLLNILLTVVISIYLLVDGDRPIRWILQIIPRSRRGQATTTIEMVRRVVGGYIRGQVLLCAIIGFLAGVGLLVLGVQSGAWHHFRRNHRHCARVNAGVGDGCRGARLLHPLAPPGRLYSCPAPGRQSSPAQPCNYADRLDRRVRVIRSLWCYLRCSYRWFITCTLHRLLASISKDTLR
jgi:hypothetical protein